MCAWRLRFQLKMFKHTCAVWPNKKQIHSKVDLCRVKRCLNSSVFFVLNVKVSDDWTVISLQMMGIIDFQRSLWKFSFKEHINLHVWLVAIKCMTETNVFKKKKKLRCSLEFCSWNFKVETWFKFQINHRKLNFMWLSRHIILFLHKSFKFHDFWRF